MKWLIQYLVNCKISSWNEWDPCSVSCGKGVKSRNRQIIVAPMNGGTPCPKSTESSNCATLDCPGKVQFKAALYFKSEPLNSEKWLHKKSIPLTSILYSEDKPITRRPVRNPGNVF